MKRWSDSVEDKEANRGDSSKKSREEGEEGEPGKGARKSEEADSGKRVLTTYQVNITPH